MSLQGAPAPVVQAVDRALTFAECIGDLLRRKAHHMPQNKDLPLCVGQPLQGVTQIPAAIEANCGMVVVGYSDFLGGYRAL